MRRPLFFWDHWRNLFRSRRNSNPPLQVATELAPPPFPGPHLPRGDLGSPLPGSEKRRPPPPNGSRLPLGSPLPGSLGAASQPRGDEGAWTGEGGGKSSVAT